jgi:hypothetical protein
MDGKLDQKRDACTAFYGGFVMQQLDAANRVPA